MVILTQQKLIDTCKIPFYLYLIKSENHTVGVYLRKSIVELYSEDEMVGAFDPLRKYLKFNPEINVGDLKHALRNNGIFMRCDFCFVDNIMVKDRFEYGYKEHIVDNPQEYVENIIITLWKD